MTDREGLRALDARDPLLSASSSVFSASFDIMQYIKSIKLTNISIKFTYFVFLFFFQIAPFAGLLALDAGDLRVVLGTNLSKYVKTNYFCSDPCYIYIYIYTYNILLLYIYICVYIYVYIYIYNRKVF